MADALENRGSLTTAPPPPAEVKIRTMRSDIASLVASGGGGMPGFENVKVAGLGAPVSSATAKARQDSRGNLWLIVVLIAVLAALVVVGWFLYAKYRG